MQSSDSFAETPQPPYFAVIFTSQRTEDAADDYADTAERMETLAKDQDGCLGFESARDDSGLGITVSYWKDLDAIRMFREDVEHAEAQRSGRERFYQRYAVRISRVERDYEWCRD